MLALVQSGGWLMAPILACSLLAMAIGLERAWALRPGRVLPVALRELLRTRADGISGDGSHIDAHLADSPLGLVVGAVYANAGRGRESMKEAMRETVDRVTHGLQRYLTALGIIASVAPLLGLLGTVVGMIEVFNTLMVKGAGSAQSLAGGIAEALITTAAGLTVAIPSIMLHRHFSRSIDGLALDMELEAGKLAERLAPDEQ